MEKRFKIILVDRVFFARRPRSKKKRIVKKWLKRPENWAPNMLPFAQRVMVGNSFVQAFGVKTEPSPYFNEEDPSRPRILEMHTLLWKKIQAEQPDFAARCDVFRRVKTVRCGVPWLEEIPVQPAAPMGG